MLKENEANFEDSSQPRNVQGGNAASGDIGKLQALGLQLQHTVLAEERVHLLAGTHYWRYIIEHPRCPLQLRGEADCSAWSKAIGSRRGRHERN